MNRFTDREKWDIGKIVEDKNYYSTLPEHRRTAAVSLVAVLSSGQNLEYVPEAILNRDICRAVLKSKDVDCTVLPQIPFPDVQKEGIQKFSGDTSAFVLYSFADISDAQMAKDAVKADAYCLQFVPDKWVTADLCKMALDSPNADKKVLGFILEKFRTPEIRKITEDKFGEKPGQQKEQSPPPKRKSLAI
jgi:hypothetical protein